MRATTQQALQVAEQEVDVERAFVRLVDDQRAVGAQHGVRLDLGEEDAVGHELDARVAAGVIVEANLAADLAAPSDAQFLRDAPGNAQRRHAARLGAADERAAFRPSQARFQTHLGQLGGLARTCLTRHDDYLMRPQRGDNSSRRPVTGSSAG